jgi:iron complex outermembrane recepter protein
MRVGNRFAAISALGALTPLIPQTALSQVLLEEVVIETQAGGGATQQGKADPSTAIDGYVAESTPTGTKTNTPLREIPQSVSVVTRDQIEDRGADSLEEVISYSAGIGVNPFGNDARFDQFIIRGFEQNITGVYRDGLRLPVFSFTGFRIEPYGVDHVDILRGPTSVLYGLNNPGGLVNVVSKMPTGEDFGEVWASVGTHEAYATGFDVGGVADNGAVSYRIVGLLQDAETQVDFVEEDRIYVAPSLTFKPSYDTTLTVLANYQKDNTGDTFQLLPADAVRDGSIDRGTFLGEPDFSHLKGENWGIGYQLEHKFDDAWTVRQNLRYDHAEVDYQSIFPAGGSPVFPGQVIRQVLDVDQNLDLFQVDTNLEHKSRFERVENTFLVGIDYSHFNGESQIQSGAVGNTGSPDLVSFDPFNPNYGQFFFFVPNPLSPDFGAGVPFATPPIPVQDQTLTQETLGIYVQDQIKIDKQWIVTLGGRYDWVESEIEDQVPATSSSSREDEAFTYRVGLGYLFENGLTPYFGYSTSFFPVPLPGARGASLEPEEAEQIEVGIKYQPKGFKSYGIVSVFDLTKQNATAEVPGQVGVFVQTGEIEVKGVELEGVADFDNGWKLFGAYSYWDAEITQDDATGNVGNRPARIPEHIASLWLDYTFRAGPLAGLELGAGVRYFGDTFGDDANQFAVGSYTLFDAGVRYEWDQWKVALNINNVFDKEYAGTCGAVGPESGLPAYEYCSYGEGRVATARISYRW